MKLNIGGGQHPIEGYETVDRQNGQEAYPLEFGDGVADEVYASHILEHFSHAEAPNVLRDWVRVLKPGGRMRLAVPDAERLDFSDPLWHMHAMGAQANEDDYHRSIYNEDRLRRLMEESGLTEVRRWESDNGDCASLPVSLNLEAVKSDDATKKTIKICGLMSIPRVGWNDNWGSILEALAPFEIPVHRFNGVFWGPNMQKGMEWALDHGVDWMLTIDYDSLFTKEHVNTLLRELGSNAEIDAIAAMQSKRCSEAPLATIKDENGKPIESMRLAGKPVKVTTAHFGLTLLRTECFAKMPKPWFMPHPDDKGGWGEGCVDPDIYFWHKWQAAGLSVYMSTMVRIGHLELVVSEFDDRYQFRQVPVQDWRDLHGVQ